MDVTLVEVDAVVTDPDGRPIRGLRAEDFTILEDGKPQAIDRLSFVDMPIARTEPPAPAAAAAPVEDVRSNRQAIEGRLYVLLLDDLHTASVRTERVRQAARRFVEENILPGDVAAVVHVGRPGGVSQDFTTDRSRLLASIDHFSGRKARSETLNRLDEYNRELLFSGRVPERVNDPEQSARANDARTVFEFIGVIARRLEPIRGRRKALLWFGEGIAYNMFDAAGTEASLVRQRSQAAIAAANRANVAVYGVDVRGLGGLGDETMQMTSPARDPTGALGPSGLTRELTRSQDNLKSLANDTGGFALVNSDEFAPAFDRIVEENSAYYVLGYYPADARRDGTFRQVQVRVNRPGAQVRARSGYLAGGKASAASENDGKPDATAALREALSAPLAQPALPMAVHVAPFKGSRDKASVLVTVEYGAAAFQGGTNGDPDANRLDASVIALSPAGAISDRDDSTIVLNVKPDTRNAMASLGFRTHARLDLAPGRYQVRVAASFRSGDLVGSVYEDVDVPAFPSSTPSMSGLVLTSVQAGYTPTASFDERMREMLPAPPTTARVFKAGEAIAVFAEVYEAGDVTMRSQIRNQAGRVVFEKETLRTAAEMKKWKNGYSLQVSLRTFEPGDYVLTLEAAPRAGSAVPLARQVGFRVVDAGG